MRWKSNSAAMINTTRGSLLVLLLILVLSTILHVRIFTTDLCGAHVWRQTATQSNIDCFYEEDQSIFNPQILARGNGEGIKRAEFPLMQWTIAKSYSVFGQSITTTRVMCFLFGSLGIVGFFLLLGALTPNRMVVLAGTMLFSFSPLYYYYMINPLPDVLALVLAIWSMNFYLRGYKNTGSLYYFLGTLFLSLATLCKLPYILFAGVPLGLLVNIIRSKRMKPSGIALLGSSIFMIPATLWYMKVLPEMTWNPVMTGVFSETKDGHPIWQSLVGNLTSSLPELFLNYASVPVFIVGLYVAFRNKKTLLHQHLPFTLTGIFLLLYFFYEINLISTVHDYYMLPFIPLLFLIAARGFAHVYESQQKVMRIAVVMLLIASPLTAYLRIDSRWNTQDPGFPSDWYAHRDELRNAVPDTSLVIMGSDMTQCIMPYYVHKRGWTYFDYELSHEKLETYIREGATFLYTDCELTIRDESLKPYFKNEVGVFGSVHVYALQLP